jgi:uncharacterized metal-binding protein YceD (DUF177 family)
MAHRKKVQNETPPPFSRPYDLSRLPEAGAEIALIPNETERAAIAQWARVESVEAFQADVVLSKRGANHVRYEVNFDVELTQACVVTLEPVVAKLSGRLKRDFLLGEALRRGARAGQAQEMIAPADDEEGPEMLPGSVLDLAVPMLEEFALSIDPYPRSPGAVFAAAAEEEAKEAESRENPFAVLQKLKKPK